MLDRVDVGIQQVGRIVLNPPHIRQRRLRLGMLKSAATAAAAIAMCHMASAERLSFRSSPLSAGRASLTEDGFRVARTLGAANFTPELAYHVEIAYESFSEKTGRGGNAIL